MMRLILILKINLIFFVERNYFYSIKKLMTMKIEM